MTRKLLVEGYRPSGRKVVIGGAPSRHESAAPTPPAATPAIAKRKS